MKSPSTFRTWRRINEESFILLENTPRKVTRHLHIRLKKCRGCIMNSKKLNYVFIKEALSLLAETRWLWSCRMLNPWEGAGKDISGLSLTVVWPLTNNLASLDLRKMRKLDYISGFQMWLQKPLENSRPPTSLCWMSQRLGSGGWGVGSEQRLRPRDL